MIIEYTVGNGYSCSCCRRSDTHTEYFSEVDEALIWLVQEAKYNDFDLCVDEIHFSRDDDPNLDELELINKFNNTLKIKEKEQEHINRVKSLKSDIAKIDSWFDELESTKSKKLREKFQLEEKLKELTDKD